MEISKNQIFEVQSVDEHAHCWAEAYRLFAIKAL